MNADSDMRIVRNVSNNSQNWAAQHEETGNSAASEWGLGIKYPQREEDDGLRCKAWLHPLVGSPEMEEWGNL